MNTLEAEANAVKNLIARQNQADEDWKIIKMRMAEAEIMKEKLSKRQGQTKQSEVIEFKPPAAFKPD